MNLLELKDRMDSIEKEYRDAGIALERQFNPPWFDMPNQQVLFENWIADVHGQDCIAYKNCLDLFQYDENLGGVMEFTFTIKLWRTSLNSEGVELETDISYDMVLDDIFTNMTAGFSDIKANISSSEGYGSIYVGSDYGALRNLVNGPGDFHLYRKRCLELVRHMMKTFNMEQSV
jgi:hypothetical protein